LANPIGIAAGFDKQGEALDGLLRVGFGFVEIGSVTPEPQDGNPKPRVFRLVADEAIINRYGFNSDGHKVVYDRLLQTLQKKERPKGLLGINLGKNKTSENAVEDYVKGIELFGPIADYLVINVSSPNTPGLRSMQSKDHLYTLLSSVVKARNQLKQNNSVPILLKLAPDLSMDEQKDIVAVLNKRDCKIDGLIISNTTIERQNLVSDNQKETGGLSGKPLAKRSTQMIAEMYTLTKGKIPIIGVGGIFSGQDALEKVLAGATVLQIYSAFIYHGPTVVSNIKAELDVLVKSRGYKNIQEAVGKEANKHK
jgi:dihydroorotate dehydrogenase